MSQFQSRYCAFIDILGFTSKVKQLEQSWDQSAFDRMRSCLSFMHDEQFESAYSGNLPVYVQVEGRLIEKELGDPRLTYISDCLVISTERSPEGFKALCRKVTKIWIDLLWDGYLCRGGISAGPLIHETTCVLGSAYMDAYELEAKASVPRVVVARSLSEIYDNFPNTFPIRPPTMQMADDGYLYLRYFPYSVFPPYAGNWSSYMLRAKEHIIAGLNKPDTRIRNKYAFAKDEFNFAVTHYRESLEAVVQVIQ